MLRLMCILAHPDDESLGLGGILARYAGEGIGTYVVTATRGERGRYGDEPERPSPEVVGATRERELRAAARVLGVAEVRFLDYVDGDLDRADPREAVARIVREIRRVRPQVIVTFGPEGAYGHPDHIAISQFATAAAVCAGDAGYDDGGGSSGAHRVSKLYYMVWTLPRWAAYQQAFRDVTTTVDGVERRAVPCPDWVVTTVVETRERWETAWEAVRCHRTQLTIYDRLAHLTPGEHQELWGLQEFYRVFSTVNGGRRRETDLFEGLRPGAEGER